MAGRESSESNKSQSGQTETIPEVESSNPDTLLTVELKIKEPETTENITSQAAVPQSNDLTQGQGSHVAGHEALEVKPPVKEPETTENIASQAVIPQSNDITQGQGSHAASHEGSNVSGTTNTLNATGDGAQIEAKDSTINAGYGAGNTEHRTDGEKNQLGGCSGTKDAVNAKNGGKINLTGTTLNLGAFSGGGSATHPAVAKGSVAASDKGKLESNQKGEFNDKDKD